MPNVLTTRMRPLFDQADDSIDDPQFANTIGLMRRATDALRPPPPAKPVVVQAASQPAASPSVNPDLANQAKRLGIDTTRSADGNVFTQPGVVSGSQPSAPTPLGSRYEDKQGNVFSYAPPAAPAHPVDPANPGANILSVGRGYQLGDLSTEMAAQSRATWGPVESLSLTERLAADRIAAARAQSDSVIAASDILTKQKLGLQ